MGAEARQTLKNFGNIGAGPHAAILAVYTLPIELSARYFIGEPNEVIRQALAG